MNKLNKNHQIFVIVVIILTLAVGFFLFLKSNKPDSKSNETLPQTEILPTVDSNVLVDLEADRKKQEVILTVSGIPAKTSTIEYELSYDADVDGESVPRGAIGTFDIAGEDSINKKITLGTCSSGTCKYDKGVEKVKVSLRFTGDYGVKIFEKEFDI